MGNANSKKPTFGLTPKEKKTVRETWKIIKKDLGRNGVVIFAMYFRDYPHNLKYFPFTIDRPEDIENEPLVKLHSLRVMREFNTYVDNMDKPETLLLALRQNALNHRKRAIARAAYDELRLSFLKGFSHQLGGDKFKPEVANAWDKALRIIFQVITDVNDERKCLCPPPSAARSASQPGPSALESSSPGAPPKK